MEEKERAKELSHLEQSGSSAIGREMERKLILFTSGPETCYSTITQWPCFHLLNSITILKQGF